MEQPHGRLPRVVVEVALLILQQVLRVFYLLLMEVLVLLQAPVLET
jgi:hypothetical protein